MTLQKRMLLALLLSAPLVWGLALLFSIDRARHEINELFDTELIRLARQVQSTLPAASLEVIEPPPSAEPGGQAPLQGDAELEDLSIAVWDAKGRLLLVDREGVNLPYRPDASGFTNLRFDGVAEPWRGYYLQSASGEWLIAVGQNLDEREELVRNLIAGQILPWVLTLPLLMLVMGYAVRRALKPVRELSHEIESRAADDLKPLPSGEVPTELQPLVTAMNALLARIGDTLDRERRFTADAAHELRTPLAALQAQWDATQLAGSGPALPARDKVSEGLARLSRLVTQLLSLSRVEQFAPSTPLARIDWLAQAEQALTDVLPLAERAHVELAVEPPPTDIDALPLVGDSALVTALLRNLLDNAVRHSPLGGQVTLRLGPEAIEVLDEGAGVADEHLPRLGDRFFRPPGEAQPGSGLGLSIVQRIAALHGLQVRWANRRDRSGFAVSIGRAAHDDRR